jgi:carboxyl-terminal processing protease
MKNKLAILFFAMILAVSSCSFTANKFQTDDDNDKDRVLIELITYVIEQGHYDMRMIDDDFSVHVYDEFLESLDPMKRHFTKKDIKDFEEFRTEIDDQIKDKDISFFNMVYNRYEESYKVTQDFYGELLSEDIDLNSNENINTDYEALDYAKNTRTLKERWRKQLKFAVLSNYYAALETQEALAKESDTVELKSTEELKQEAVTQAKESIERYFSNSNDLRREDWFNLYVNTVVTQFDPHTNYLAPRDKDKFDVSMSGKLEGIGARLQKLSNSIKIVEIISGGPAWKSNQLEKDDLILEVKQEDEDLPVNISRMRIDDAVELIKGPKGTKVTLKIKKPDGTFKHVTLVRDVVEIEETYAKSTIIKKGDVEFGFINLPKFYFNMENYRERNAAADIKKEIEELKKSDVEGLVIDLRNNGGGSLTTVVEMAGLFIDKGPVVQVKNRDGEVEVLEDKKRGAVWDGPLVILVNEFSASASEILAAAMQDYKRAVILGSRQTYGKGTVQNVADLNRWIKSNSLGDMGALKLTTQKFYRVSGGSTQLKGVESDVVVPDRYSYINIGERDYENPLPYDKIQEADYKSWQGYNGLEEVIKASQKRMDTNQQIALIEKQAQWIKMQRDKNEFPLNFDEYKRLMEETDEEADKFEKISDYKNALVFQSLPNEVKAFETDEALKDKRENWHNSLQKDIYVEEAIFVLEDLRQHTKNFKLADATFKD